MIPNSAFPALGRVSQVAVEFKFGEFLRHFVEGKIKKNEFLAKNQSLVSDVQLVEYRKIFLIGNLPMEAESKFTESARKIRENRQI